MCETWELLPLCETWELLRVEPFMWTFVWNQGNLNLHAEPGNLFRMEPLCGTWGDLVQGFRLLPKPSTNFIGKNPSLSSCWGKFSLLLPVLQLLEHSVHSDHSSNLQSTGHPCALHTISSALQFCLHFG